MAADLTDPQVSPVDQPLVEGPRRPAAARRPHRNRFVAVYAILGLALAVGIAGLVVYAGRAINPGPAWSSWKPSGGGLGAAKQIAAHIAPTYRLPDGNQLVDVIAQGPELSSGGQAIPIAYVANRGPQGKILVDTVTPVSNGDTLTFMLCGLGTSCSIATGKPSVQRGTLVRREILELSLYTFKYVSGIKRIVAFLPPPAGTQPTYAVYLQKSDLQQELKVPLTRTLSPKVPLPNTIPPAEEQKIDGLTEAKTFKFSLSQTQLGDAVLVLQSLPQA
jgi:hypothetical protein